MDTPTQDPTLLIVENDAVFRDKLAKVMANRGFTPLKASGVTEANALISEREPAYAVIDLHLDDGSGLEVIETLKQKKNSARAIVLTGYGNTPTAVAAVKLGAIDYLAKPADANEIVDALMVGEGGLPPAPDNPISPEEAKRQHIERFLERTDGNITRTARLLKMHRRTLQRILKREPEPGETENGGQYEPNADAR